MGEIAIEEEVAIWKRRTIVDQKTLKKPEGDSGQSERAEGMKNSRSRTFYQM
jgi:hypothetical protein